MTYGIIIGGILSSVVSPLIGRWSDKIGRVKAMICNLTGLISADVVGIMIASSPSHFSYRWLYLAFALDGLRYVPGLN
jgi:MFS family permease